jgi:hypothetical protein
MTTCLKIEMAWALYKAIDTLCLKKAQKITKGGPSIPFFYHTMLAHRWKKTIFFVDESNQKPLWWGEEMHFQDANSSKIFSLPKSPLLQLPRETLWTNNIMSTTHWKAVTKAHEFDHMKPETLNFLQWKWRQPNNIMWMQSVPHHEYNEKSGSLLVIKVDHKCNELT